MNAPRSNARCRACGSAHRGAIDERLLGGESARSVSAWLAETHGERIPFQALANHKAEHLDARAEAAAQVEAAQPAFEAAVDKIVADVSALDEVAALSLKVARALAPTLADPNAKPAMPVVTLFTNALASARAAVTDRHELLHGKKQKVEVTTPPSAATDPEAIHARVASLVARATGGAPPEPPRAPEPEGAGGDRGGPGRP